MAIANGGLLTIGVSKNWGGRWSTSIVAYYDRFSVSGGQSENSLLPFSLNDVPLDLPERAIFSNPQGEFTHTGVGIIASHGFDIPGSSWSWDTIGGLLFEQLDLNNFSFDYELISGADAGKTGVLDHSGQNNFIYYIIGIQAKKSVFDHYIIIPRLIFGRPGSDGDFTTRLTGPGFDLSTASTGAEPHNIGDDFAYIGMTLRDSQSHLEVDIGAILGFAGYEYIAHEGINTALVVSLTWRI